MTLGPRFNPNAPDTRESAAKRLPDRVDVRQMVPFGAAWTAGSLKYLAEAGADSVTRFMNRRSGRLG
jgi:hypothetical protein